MCLCSPLESGILAWSDAAVGVPRAEACLAWEVKHTQLLISADGVHRSLFLDALAPARQHILFRVGSAQRPRRSKRAGDAAVLRGRPCEPDSRRCAGGFLYQVKHSELCVLGLGAAAGAALDLDHSHLRTETQAPP